MSKTKELTIAEEIKKIRLSKFFTQQQMADYMDMTIVTYNHLECGHKRISLKTIEKISKLTGHGYSYIMEHLK